MDAEELIEERTGENEYERKAREGGELLQELRVMLPGVQVLFAFLLTVPFSARFGYLTPVQQAVFFGTLLCTALSAGLLLAPSAHHRLLWRQQAREASPAGCQSSRHRGHGAARGGDGRGDVRDHRHPVRLCRRHSDRCGQRLLPRGVVLDADPIPIELNLAAPKANRKR